MTSGEQALVLFDGRCGFCAWSVQFAQRVVGSDAHFIPYQSVDVTAYGLSVQECAQAVQFVDSAGRRSAERAVAAILRSGRGVWRPIGRILGSAPVQPLAGVVYRVVARHRGRLWGVQPPLT